MDKRKFIFAESEEAYIYSIICKFIEEQGENICIECITDEEYLKSICQEPVKCDVLVMKEEWYYAYFLKQNIETVFLLCENVSGENTSEIHQIYKYSSVKEIYLNIVSGMHLEKKIAPRDKRTILYAVHSAVGGSGKTTLALGLCCALKKYSSRVLYLNLESIQNFNYLMDNREYMEYSQWNQNISQGLEAIARTQGFEYVPPLKQSALLNGISYSRLLNITEQTKSRNIYDYIVVELPLDLDMERLPLLNTADKVIFVTRQDALSVWKTERFLENIDYSDWDRFLLVCNFYSEKSENCIMHSRKLSVSEHIPQTNNPEELCCVRNMAQSNAFDRLVYLLL
ncbi:MAG: AAA family ATPase [Acetatifactor sp.]|nr:AAA family ATPase [Acetatifactor sp.]